MKRYKREIRERYEEWFDKANKKALKNIRACHMAI